MSSMWNKPLPQVRKGTEHWKDVLPKSSTLQDLMTKVYAGAYVNGELSINVIGAEVQKNNTKWMGSHPFCVLQLKSIDGTKLEGKQFKTAIIHKDVNPCWNEAFIMDLRSKTEVALWIDVRSYSKIGKDKPLGRCVLALDNLTENIPIERQYPLLCHNDRDEMGTITMRMTYTSAIRRNLDFVIASENYDLLSKVLFEKEGTLVEALCQVCKDDDLSLVLIRLFNAHGLGCHLLAQLMSAELRTRGEPVTLFRNDSMATKTMRNYFHLISRKSYLNRQIMPVVNEINSIIQNGGSLEVFPNMLKEGEVLEANIQNLWTVTSHLIERVLNSFDIIPGNIKKFFGVLGKMLETKYGSVLLSPAGSLFFLRFFCPGIVFPVECGIVQAESMNPAINRGLLLVGKLVQGVTGRVEFREDMLYPFNPLMRAYHDQVDHFLSRLCSPASAHKDPSVMGPVDDPRQPYSKDELSKLLAIILRKINIHFDKLSKFSSEDKSKNIKIREITTLMTAIFQDSA